jgi:hypothetical protein
MTRPQRLAAARAFWSDKETADDQIQANVLIAQQKKFRPKSVAAMDLDRKTQHLASLAALPEALAARVLVVYHLTEKRPMMRAFLDALGLPHEDGLIQDDVKPDESKLAAAAAKISEEFAAEDVDLYLNTLLCQDPETWSGLRGLPQLQAPQTQA